MDGKNDRQIYDGQITVTYLLLGDFSPESITSQVRFSPSQTGVRGELIHSRTPARRGQIYWSLRTVGKSDSTLEELVQELLRQLEPCWNGFVELGHKYQAMIGCDCVVRGATGPEMYLESAILSRLVGLSAALDVDILCLAEDVEE